jgi:hypothetical protein
MLVYGVDFTSAPGPRRPIAVAQCVLEGDRLAVRDLLRLRSFEQLERGLERSGPWIAGFDFPFGQARRLVRELGWPEGWAGYVAHAARLSRPELDDLLRMYRAAHSRGDRERSRRTDEAARAQPSSKTRNPPLAFMFQEGAARLLRSPLSVVPCRPTDDPRVAVEAYPALVVRALVGPRHGYKGGGRDTQARRDARRAIVAGLRSERLAQRYGLTVELGHFLTDGMVRDPRGDLLDAALAAVQAAWAWLRREEGFGVPESADPREGWIVDPATARG